MAERGGAWLGLARQDKVFMKIDAIISGNKRICDGLYGLFKSQNQIFRP